MTKQIAFLLLFFITTIPLCSEELQMSADRVDRIPEENVVVLTGHAQVKGPELDISANVIRVFQETRKIEAEGDVRAVIQENHIEGSRIHYDLVNEAGTVFDGRLRLQDGTVFDADEIHTIGKDRFNLVNAAMTTCPDCCRYWSFHAENIRIKREGYAFFRKLSFRVGDHSWLYLPGFIYPAKTKRALGLLIPEIGNSSKLGFKYRQDLFIPIGDTMDVTYTHDYYSKAGTGTGFEFRLARTPDEYGRFYLYSIHDRLKDQRRSIFDAHYAYDTSWGRIAFHSLEGDDFDLIRDFTFHEYDLAMRNFSSTFSVEIARDKYRLILAADRQNILFQDGEFLFSQTPVIHASWKTASLLNHQIRLQADARYLDNP